MQHKVKEYPQSEYIVYQYILTCLGQISYLVVSSNQAFVVDPRRQYHHYIQHAQNHSAKIKYVLQTHFHVDFTSCNNYLSAQIDFINQGAQIIYGPNAKANYKIIQAQNQQQFKVGSITIKVIHTPGHTLQSCCFLILDSSKNQKCIFTGDTIFINSIGRPDLSSNEKLNKQQFAKMMYHSIQKLKQLNKQIKIFPSHGAGSLCGSGMSTQSTSTLGSQLQSNQYLKQISQQEFVRMSLMNLPMTPIYFKHVVHQNKTGPLSFDQAFQKANNKLPLQTLDQEGIIILDTRSPNLFAKQHIPNSLNVCLQMNYAICVGSLIDNLIPIVLICAQGKQKESITRLMRISYDNIKGYIQGGIQAYKKAGKPLKSNQVISPQTFKQKIEHQQNALFLDVRRPDELKTEGQIRNCLNVQLSQLEKKINQKNDISEKIMNSNKLFVYCRVGNRSQVACSILQRNGYKGILYNIQGGIKKLKQLKQFINEIIQ